MILRILVLQPCAIALRPHSGHRTCSRPGQNRCGANSTTQLFMPWKRSGLRSRRSWRCASNSSVGLGSGLMKSGSADDGHGSVRLLVRLFSPGTRARMLFICSST